jgi:hypothetical protein
MKRQQMVFGLMVIALLASALFAEKRIGGIISTDKRLSPDEGPYLIDRDILITRKGRLTVMAGTRLLIGKLLYYDDSIPQIDGYDSQMVSIKVQGIMRFLGKRSNRITISAATRNQGPCSWYGIAIQGTGEAFNEIAFTDIADACFGVTVENASPLIRNSVLEYNNIGIRCQTRGNARISNCIVANNFASGILVSGANPSITNSILAFNHNSGIWCDQTSEIDMAFNCIYGNSDGNFMDCNPDFGKLKKVNDNKDSVDFRQNIRTDPMFAGSAADSGAAVRDLNRKIDMRSVKDTALAKINIGKEKDTASASEPSRTNLNRYSLSKFSPCRNAGNPAKEYRDPDGSRNDIGIFGGPDFLESKKE